jgi:Flp pilus assembly protein TadD
MEAVMQSRTETSFVTIACRVGLCAAGTLLLAACATTAPVPKEVAAQATALVGLQQSETGFTVAEDVRVGPETQTEYDNAMRLLEQKEYGPGVALLVKFTQSSPAVTAPYVDLGIAYSRLGDLDKAEASLKRALELNPRHPIAYNELGMVYRRKGQFEAARASYQKAIALVPGFHYAHLNLAILCDLYLADLSCALDNYLAYQQAVPNDAQASIWIADVRARAGR